MEGFRREALGGGGVYAQGEGMIRLLLLLHTPPPSAKSFFVQGAFLVYREGGLGGGAGGAGGGRSPRSPRSPRGEPSYDLSQNLSDDLNGLTAKGFLWRAENTLGRRCPMGSRRGEL